MYLRILTFLLLTVMTGLAIAQSPKDTLVVKQGDRLIGSFQSMSKGIAQITTEYSSEPILIKWSEVKELKTHKHYRVIDEIGRMYQGKIAIDSFRGTLFHLYTEDSILYLNKNLIFDIAVYEKGSLNEKITLKADLGYTFTKQNNTNTGSLGINFGYQAKRWVMTADYLGFLSRVDSISSKRGSLEGNVRYLLANNWFAMGRAALYYSSEQDINNRITLLWGGGNYLMRRKEDQLYLYAGGTFNREKYRTVSATFSSLETFSGLRYEHGLIRGLNTQGELVIFPSLTEKGRTRLYIKTDLGYNISLHFRTGVQFVMNSDSKPPVTSSKSDYIVSFRFAWHL